MIIRPFLTVNVDADAKDLKSGLARIGLIVEESPNLLLTLFTIIILNLAFGAKVTCLCSLAATDFSDDFTLHAHHATLVANNTHYLTMYLSVTDDCCSSLHNPAFSVTKHVHTISTCILLLTHGNKPANTKYQIPTTKNRL